MRFLYDCCVSPFIVLKKECACLAGLWVFWLFLIIILLNGDTHIEMSKQQLAVLNWQLYA